jgi:serine-type D-Ala-D-Ala carboxypeptidase (penicillin-binding protein 5/6)
MMNKNIKKHMREVHPIIYIYAGVFVLIICLIASNVIDVISDYKKTSSDQAFFDSLPIKAQSVYVYDHSENRIIYARNEHTPLPLASITKLMTINCVLDNSDINKDILVPNNVFDPYVSTSSPRFFETWSIKDLAIYTLVESSNVGAEVLAQNSLGEQETIDCMNKSADEMDLFETHFFNVSGLDMDIQRSGAYGSSENVANMFEYIYRKYADVLNVTSYSSYDVYSKNGIIHTAENTNIVSQNITGLLASKTGYTDLSGGNLVFMMNVGLNHKVIVVILGSTKDDRFSDAVTISKAVVESFSR